MRSKWYKIIQDNGKDLGLDLDKPNRFGNGEYMTVCVFNDEYREAENGLLNIVKTVALLRKAERVLNSASENA